MLLKKKKLLLFMGIFSIMHAADRMTPRDLKSSLKKDKKSSNRLKFKVEKPPLSQDPEKILDTSVAKNSNPWFFQRWFSDDYNESFDKLDIKQLRKQRDDVINTRTKDVAEKYFNRIILVSTDHDEIREARLALAFNLFDRELYEKAAKELNAFLSYYPSDKRAEFAAYLEILSLDLCRCDYMRDQTATRDLINKAYTFLAHEKYSTYKPYVQTIVHGAYIDLYNAEYLKFDFYARRGEIKALEQIVERIKKDIGTYVDIRKQIKQMESSIQAIKDGKPYVPQDPWQAVERNTSVQKKTTSFRDRF